MGTNGCWIATIFLAGIISSKTYASSPNHADMNLSDSLRSFFQQVIVNAEKFKQTSEPSPFKNSTKYIWDNFRVSTSGTRKDFHEVTDPNNDKITRGYLEIRFQMPASMTPIDYPASKNLAVIPPPPKLLYDIQNRTADALKYECGCIGFELTASDAFKYVKLTLQIYEDTRSGHWYNAYRYWLPTQLAHLNQDHLEIYMSWALLGVIEEWFRLASIHSDLQANPFSDIIYGDLLSYLTDKRYGYVLKWVSLHNILRLAYPDYEILTDTNPETEGKKPSLSEVTPHLATYVGASQRRPFVATFDAIHLKFSQIQALYTHSADESLLPFLFHKKIIDDRVFIDFCYGAGHLPVYFSRLAFLGGNERSQECSLLIKLFPELIPQLLKARSNKKLMQTARATVLKDVAEGELRDIQRQLLEIRRTIEMMAPSKEKSTFSIKAVAKGRSNFIETGEAGHQKTLNSDHDRLEVLLKQRPFYSVVMELNLKGYPRTSLEEDNLNISFPYNNLIYTTFMKQFHKMLPTYFSAGGSQEEPESFVLEPLQSKVVKIKGFSAMPQHAQDILGELFVNIMTSQLKSCCGLNPASSVNECMSLIGAVHNKVLDRLEMALMLIGDKSDLTSPRKKGRNNKISDYLAYLERLPAESKIFLSYTEENITLYRMSLDLTVIGCADIYQPGALDFLAQHHNRLNPDLLNLFADCYFMRYAQKDAPNPLGMKPDPRLGSLLSSILVPNDPQSAKFIGQDWPQKKLVLGSILTSLRDAYKDLCNFSFGT